MRVSLSKETVWFDVVGEKETLIDSRRIVKPTLIFVHGGGGTHAAARPWANKLADLAQCIILDLPGHGRSSLSSSSRWNLSDWADVLAEFCRTLDIQQPIFMGGSMGGYVVQSLAIRHPGLASKLLLVATAAVRDKALVQMRFAELGGAEAGAASERLFADSSSPAAFAEYMRVCMPLYSVVHGAKIGEFLAKNEVMGPTERTTFNWFSRPGGEFETFDFRSGLASVMTPTLIIAGALDPIIPLAAAKEMYECFAHGVARLEILARSSHLVSEDQPEESMRLIREFIGSATV